MLTVVFRDEKSADQITKMLPTMMRDALIYVLDKSSWRGENTRIFIEYPETGQQDRMSCWNQRLQLYRGIEKGISNLSLEYDKDLASGSQPLPDLGDLNSPNNIEYWKDIWAKVQQQGDKAFVDYFDRWKALAANVFQMTQLPREEITFLYPIVKEYSTRLKLHCVELESSIKKMGQRAKQMEKTKQKQQQSIEMLRREIRALKEVMHNSVLAFQLLLSRFEAGIDSKTQLAITRPERITVPFKTSEEEKARDEDKVTRRLEVPQLLKNMQGTVVCVERRFENYKLQIENQQDNLCTALASLSSAEENVKQLLRESADNAYRIETLTKDLQISREDFKKVTGSLIERQNVISDMEDRLVSNRRWQRSSVERYTVPVESEHNIQESKSSSCRRKEKTEEDDIQDKVGTQTLVDSKKEIRELKEEMAGKDVVIKKLASDLCNLKQSYKQQSLEHGSVRTELDTLQSRLYEVQEAVQRQSEEPLTLKGKHSELVRWIENHARQSRVLEESLKTLQYQQENLREEHKKAVEEKNRQIRDLRKEVVDRLTVKEERDKLELILYQLKEVVSPHVEGELSFENGFTHLVSWVENAARESLNSCQIHQNTQPMEQTKRLKLETNFQNIESVKKRVQEATQVIAEKPQAIQTYLNNHETNAEKSMPSTTTGDEGNVTKCMYTNKLGDSYNNAIKPTDQMDKILGFFFDRYNCKIEAAQSKYQLLQKELDNMEVRLDVFINVLTTDKPICCLADFLSSTMTEGDKNSHVGVTDKLYLLIKRVSEGLRQICIHTSQREVEIVQGTDDIQTADMMSNSRTGKTTHLQHRQLSHYPPNTQSKTAKRPTPPKKDAIKADLAHKIETRSIQEPAKQRTLRPARSRQNNTSGSHGLDGEIASFSVKIDPKLAS
ncbi:hypothetical protein FANTH_6808 [Fusarium anthophilum]|uniref:Uncharacterized protein n=1 Tax=Fusarium anthophilum TaxID=48485 RepID=A0A8H5E492_9HYPO|nr:hypothetical protein FANTH_6808 [Fusarium anthophilum]